MCFVTLVKLFDLLNYTLGNEKSLFRLNYEHKNERVILFKSYIFFLYFIFHYIFYHHHHYFIIIVVITITMCFVVVAIFSYLRNV